MEGLERDSVFVALTRPQMFAGVTYTYFIGNAIVATELFLIFRSMLAIVAALIVHMIGVMLSLREPRFLDIWLTRAGRCPRVRNYAIWRCNSYRA